MASTNLPLAALRKSINKKIKVWLKDGTVIEGTVISTDEVMNIMMVDARELNDEGEVVRKWGTILLRGSTILMIQVFE
ncbi:MAG: LSM domain-containing protein [Candidatus Njordarchaeota archaeon]